MAREVTLAVQSTLCRAHLPIPSSAGLLGSGELGDGAGFLLPMARVLAMHSSAVRGSEGVSLFSRVKELHQTHENPAISESSSAHRAHAVVRLLCPYTCRICWPVESQTEAQGHSAQHQRPQIPT